MLLQTVSEGGKGFFCWEMMIIEIIINLMFFSVTSCSFHKNLECAQKTQQKI